MKDLVPNLATAIVTAVAVGIPAYFAGMYSDEIKARINEWFDRRDLALLKKAINGDEKARARCKKKPERWRRKQWERLDSPEEYALMQGGHWSEQQSHKLDADRGKEFWLHLAIGPRPDDLDVFEREPLPWSAEEEAAQERRDAQLHERIEADKRRQQGSGD